MRRFRLNIVWRTGWAISALLVTAGTYFQAEAQDWSFDVAPYLWVASVGVETSLPSVGTGSSSVERFDTRIKAGAMLAAQVHYRSFGLFADFAWLRLDTEAIDPGPAYSAIDLKSDFIHSTAALSYRLPLDGKLQVEALAGARIWYVANDFEASSGLLPSISTSRDSTWADPMVGAAIRYELTKKWSVGVRGFAGGFHVSADIAAEVFAGVAYQFTECVSVTLGYRYLLEEYDRAFQFDLDAQGFLIGAGFHF